MNRCDSQYDRPLYAGWKIQASFEVKGTPEEISRPDFDTRGWYSASVPSTVLAALVENGVYQNPYFGMNLKNISSKPFSKPWWYRTQFPLLAQDATGTVLLEFDGVNYSANIWLNGHRVAASSQIKGAFRRFQFDVSKLITVGENVLAVEVIPPQPGDFSTGFVDWNPPPPDRNMGIFRTVRLRFCRDVSIENPFVRTDLNAETLDEAGLTITAELTNHTDGTVSGTLEGEIESIRFRKAVTIDPQERKTVQLADLKIARPRVWWPHDMGAPELYDLHLRFIADDKAADVAGVRFGIRKVED